MEETRYARQTLLWGEQQQQKIAAATVLIAGIGGLGATVSELLVRAGVGKLYLVDDGKIDWPDLNRQILYSEDDIGRLKCDVAKAKLQQINHRVHIEPLPHRIDPAFRCPADVSIVADCLDNYTSRFTLEAGMKDGSFLIHGGIEGNQGQVLTLKKGESQPLAAIFAGTQQPAGDIPVSGAGAAIIAGYQTHEIINTISDRPHILNRFLIVSLNDLHLDFLDV